MPTRKVSNFLYEDLSYKVRGAIFNVYNTLGFGHKEGVYQKALALEFEKQRIPFVQEKRLSVVYEGKKVGFYQPDFVVDGKIIIELKAVEFLPRRSMVQLTYYLKGTNHRLGFLVNFGSSKLDIRRRINL